MFVNTCTLWLTALQALGNINTLHFSVDKASTQAQHCTGSNADLVSTLSITAVFCPLLSKHATPCSWLLRWFTLDSNEFLFISLIHPIFFLQVCEVLIPCGDTVPYGKGAKY
jgi:hypothetical protein